jgi:UDP-N-acetylmuramoyl-L-alanyl-D-glutamate--2,6-diaminopimelate ligase
MSRPDGRVGSRPVDRSFPHVPLAALAAVAPGAEIRGAPETLVADAAYDSRDAAPGVVFFCIAGERRDGHDFAGPAVAAGAAALVVERWLDGLPVPQVRVPAVRVAIGPMSAEVFGSPATGLTVVGVTGTNGKTTTTYLLEAIVSAAGRTPGVVGTTGARIDGRPEVLARTTPEAPDLHRLLWRMRRDGVDTVALEVSSHALAQGRVDGLVVDVALFTNLSQDHLDFHGSLDAYFAAKATLFTPALARRGIVNADDPWGRRLLETPAIPTTTYALDRDADITGHDVRVDRAGLSFTVDGTVFRSPLRGRFNAANCLAAVAVARALGMGDDVTAAALASHGGVPGRMEPVEAGQDFLVVVDYAHTPDSILGVLRGARPLATGRVIVVFGCGGDRDRAKRPAMGRAATSEADLTVITTDNPRSEDPLRIIDEIVAGAGGGGAYVVEPDRRTAIAHAVRDARAGDVVVIAGKGHETVQELRGDSVPFDDRVVAREELERAAHPDGARP